MPRLPGCWACWLPPHCLAALDFSSTLVYFLILRVPLFLRFFSFASFSFYLPFLFVFYFTLLISSFLSFSYSGAHVAGRLADWVLYALRHSSTFTSVLHTLPYALRTEPSLPCADPVPWLRVVTFCLPPSRTNSVRSISHLKSYLI